VAYELNGTSAEPPAHATSAQNMSAKNIEVQVGKPANSHAGH
jgi:hypothetical protein